MPRVHEEQIIGVLQGHQAGMKTQYRCFMQ
jgi:hypothetical protein